MVQQPISITALASISPLGESLEETWGRYKEDSHCFSERPVGFIEALVAELPEAVRNEIDDLRQSDLKYRSLDDSVLFAIYTGRKAMEQAGWKPNDDFGINIGSSRGATALFEQYHSDFIKNNKAQVLSSPTTTLGNISSWVAHDLQTKGPEISHSITCSTALHALLNGVAWITSGMSKRFMVGGSEAPLTPFTVAQMKALKIYAKQNGEYPCKALDFTKNKNGMILGEAASMACLEPGEKENALAIIKGIGYATEVLEHNASLSTNADCFQRSMRMALGGISPTEVDVIVTHTPGTVKGDLAEMNAIEAVFGENLPALTTNKWKVGHSFGASGMLNIEMAILMLQHQEFIPVPYVESVFPERVKTILVNAVGFGGNAVSVLLSK